MCLVETKDFNPSPKWIASRLSITVEKALDAIEGLTRMGCVIKIGDSYRVNQEWFQLTPKELDRAALLRSQSRIVPQLMSKLTENDAFTSQFILADEEIIKRFAPRFMELFKQMDDEGKKTGKTQITAVQMSFAKVTPEIAGSAQ